MGFVFVFYTANPPAGDVGDLLLQPAGGRHLDDVLQRAAEAAADRQRVAQQADGGTQHQAATARRQHENSNILVFYGNFWNASHSNIIIM